MDPTPSLLGPPEIHRPTTTSSSVADPFMDLMVANFNSTTSLHTPPMGFTENLSATFLSTGNPCLDFFFHVVPNTPPESLTSRLQSAWAHNPLTALKLICNLRGTGKSDKEGYYTAALWLHKHHPKTLACNVASLAEFGYFKDLPEILFRLPEGPDLRRINKSARGSKVRRRRFGRLKQREMITKTKGKTKTNTASSKEARVLAAMKREEIEKQAARSEREEKKIAAAKKAVHRYGSYPDYRFFHDRVSDLFADCLKSDIESLNSGQSNRSASQQSGVHLWTRRSTSPHSSARASPGGSSLASPPRNTKPSKKPTTRTGSAIV